MVKYIPNKRNLAIAIRENYAAGMKAKKIAELFQISKQRVNYWIHNSVRKKKKKKIIKKRNKYDS